VGRRTAKSPPELSGRSPELRLHLPNPAPRGCCTVKVSFSLLQYIRPWRRTKAYP
jgi:hypothetical protein